MVCKLLAVVQHYAWLCSFLWTNVIAYDIYRTFSAPLRSRGTGTSSPRIPWSRLFIGWIAAAIYVAVCVALSELWSQQTGIRYSRTMGACFISSGLLYYFVVPLAGSLSLNVVLFAATVVKLRRALDEGQRLRKAKTTSRLLVFARLSSLMGFTWILGFAANGLSELWYVFVVANSCQGVLVFLSFVCNARTLQLCRQKMHACDSNLSTHALTQHTQSSNASKYTPSTNETTE